MEFRLKISLGNAAMTDGFEVGEALEALAERIRGIYDMPRHVETGGELYGSIRDTNGNRVGSWEVSA